MDINPGAWLREQLERASITPAQLARHLGVSESRVYSWLRGPGKPGDDNARTIAELLDKSEIEVRIRLGLYVPREALYIDAARRKIAIYQEAARTKRDREKFDELAGILYGEGLPDIHTGNGSTLD